MSGLLDLVDAVNVLARLEALAGMAWYRRAGAELRVSRRGELSGADCVALLRRRGVWAWGGRTTSDWFVLYVSDRQRAWAEYILLRAGAELARVSNPQTARWAAGHAGPPPAWADSPRAQPPRPARRWLARFFDL